MNVQLFYHVAVMGPWSRICDEQLTLFDRVGLRPMIGIVGPTDGGFNWRGDVLFHHPNIREYELPTIDALWNWCRVNPGDVAIYAHTKGVSAPNRRRGLMRHLVHRTIIERWKENLPILNDHDVVGFVHVSRNRGVMRDFFRGNFWMIRADYASTLPSPLEYSKTYPAHRRRYAAEMWPLISLKCRWAEVHKDGLLGDLARELCPELFTPTPHKHR